MEALKWHLLLSTCKKHYLQHCMYRVFTARTCSFFLNSFLGMHPPSLCSYHWREGKDACNEDPFCSFLRMLVVAKFWLANLHWEINIANSHVKSAMRKSAHQILIGDCIDSWHYLIVTRKLVGTMRIAWFFNIALAFLPSPLLFHTPSAFPVYACLRSH